MYNARQAVGKWVGIVALYAVRGQRQVTLMCSKLTASHALYGQPCVPPWMFSRALSDFLPEKAPVLTLSSTTYDRSKNCISRVHVMSNHAFWSESKKMWKTIKFNPMLKWNNFLTTGLPHSHVSHSKATLVPSIHLIWGFI